MGTTTTTYGLIHPDTTGPNVTWAASYQANLLLIEEVMTGQKMWNLSRSAWETPRAGLGYFVSVANNGSNKIRITCGGHGLITGDSINIHDSSVAGYNGTGLSVTRVTADTFDITATAYSSTGTGYWYCAANVFRAKDQDCPAVPGSVVRSLYYVNMPNVNGTPALFNCTNLIRFDVGGRTQAGYERGSNDPAIATVKDIVRTTATGDVKSYNATGAITNGQLVRIDFVE